MCNNARFNDIGVELQMNSNNWWAAKRNYLHSCQLCVMRPGAPKCEHCPIREAMLVNAKIFERKMPRQELIWVEKEKKLL